MKETSSYYLSLNLTFLLSFEILEISMENFSFTSFSQCKLSKSSFYPNSFNKYAQPSANPSSFLKIYY